MLPSDTSLFFVVSDTFSIACLAMEMEVSFLFDFNALTLMADSISRVAGKASCARMGT
jgi:hypothetical protein